MTTGGEVEDACVGSHLVSIQIKDAGPHELAPSTTSSESDEHPDGSGVFWFLCSWRTFSQNLLLAFLLGLALTLDYFNMLVVMTYNVGLFVAVVMGYVIGSLMFMHVGERYAKRLRVMRARRRREAAALPRVYRVQSV